MSAPLYEPCSLCDGTGTPRPEAEIRVEPKDRLRVADLFRRGICLGCEGKRYLPIGLTTGQVERLQRERDALREAATEAIGFVRRAIQANVDVPGFKPEDHPTLAGLIAAVYGQRKAGQGPGVAS
jgi:hypothetical protein